MRNKLKTILYSIHPSLHPILPLANRQPPPRGVLQLEGSQSLVASCEVSPFGSIPPLVLLMHFVLQVLTRERRNKSGLTTQNPQSEQLDLLL